MAEMGCTWGCKLRFLRALGGCDADSAEHGLLAVAAFDGVDGLVEADHFLGVFVEFDLVVAGDEAREADAEKADEHAAIVEFVEEFPGGGKEDVIGVGEVDRFLSYDGVEIGVAKLDGDAAGEFVLAAEVEADGFGHSYQLRVEEGEVDGIGFESMFGGDGLLFAVGNDRRFVEAVGFSPEPDPIFPKHGAEHFDGDIAECLDRLDAAADQLVGRFPADAGQFGDSEGCKKAFFPAKGDLELAIGLYFVCRDLADELVACKRIGDGQSALLYYPAFQLLCKEAATKEFIHSREIDVEFIDGRFFERRYILLHDLGDDAGVFRIGFHVAADDDGFRAETPGQFYRHGAVDAEFSGLIAAGCYDATIAGAANQQRFAFEGGVFQAFHRDEEGVEIEVGNVTAIGGCRMVDRAGHIKGFSGPGV